ncbi:hypothetical protein VNO80_31543 [Phaseolus coccineus]|uniref:Uncharacterized protein n=1 Tax=Phaseolus coccineus TaxID=3886 RepID=A0AAN9Q9V0_PHACN
MPPPIRFINLQIAPTVEDNTDRINLRTNKFHRFTMLAIDSSTEIEELDMRNAPLEETSPSYLTSSELGEIKGVVLVASDEFCTA